MTNTDMLINVIDQSGVSITALAEKIGCSRNRIYAIVHGEGGECTASEIVGLTEALHLTSEQRDAIFFDVKCD